MSARNADILEYVEEKELPIAEVYNMGHEHTGCFPCGFGAHENSKFVLLKQTHPRLWNHCINKLGMNEDITNESIKPV